MRISRNTIINLVGAIVPLLLTLVTLPIYLRLIGDIRFGVLALVWLLLSYFGLFDMGLGRATSKYIAESHDRPAEDRESLFWTVLFLNAAMGIVGGIVLWGTGQFLLGNVLKVPSNLNSEVASAVPWLAAAVPVATVVSVLIGSLEGREQFLSPISCRFSALVFSSSFP
jgi:O-antigen/teichoic acid export membrane protein